MRRVLVLVILALAVCGKAAEPVAVIPKVGLYYTAEEIARAQERAQTETWAISEKNRIIAEANRWLAYPDEWYYQIIPPKGSIFSYGRTGSPVNSTAWPNFGNGLIRLDQPGKIFDPSGVVLDFDNPDSQWYDPYPGRGITRNGQRFYLRATYNAYITDQLAGWGHDRGAVHLLSYAYALTGDPRYGQKAAVIMDALATLSPTTIGPRDFQRSETSVEGRLHWLSSIVNRSRMHMLGAYDLIYNHPFVQQESPTTPGKTVAENIEAGLVLDYLFHEHDLRNGRMISLHNHEADEARAMLGVGLIMGIPDYIRWGLDSVYVYYDNTVDRDGLYYEGSLSYGLFARGVYLDMADLARTYDPSKYEGEGFPKREDYPYELNLYDHPKLRHLVFGQLDRVEAAGQRPAFGNSGEVGSRRIEEFTRSVDDGEWLAVYKLYSATQDLQFRQDLQSWLLQNGDPNSRLKGYWALAAGETLQGARSFPDTANPQSDLLGGKILAILRSGEGPNRRAALLRGGSNLPHAHDDVLGLGHYAKGYELHADIGYGTFGAPVHLGWGQRQIAHNLVVINEDMNRHITNHRLGPGSTVHGFAAHPEFSYTELSAEKMYMPQDGVNLYRRAVAMIDIDEFDSYLVDVFRVQGGKTHDYSYHTIARWLGIQGTEINAQEGLWSLAGLSNPQHSTNKEGQSWGERIVPGDHIRDLGIPGENVAPRYWVPEPGNGYGFLHDVKVGDASQGFQALWRVFDGSDTQIRLWMAPQEETTLYQAKGPNRTGTTQYPFIVVRRQGEALKSMYTAVIEPFQAFQTLESVEYLPTTDPLSAVIKATLDEFYGGGIDYILSTMGPQEVAESSQAVLHGRYGLVRHDAQGLRNITLVNGTYLEADGFGLRLAEAELNTEILEVDYRIQGLRVGAQLPLGKTLAGKLITINHPSYEVNTSYRMAGVIQAGSDLWIDLGNTSFALARGSVDRILGRGRFLTTNAPLPTGYTYNHSTGVMTGKLLVGEATGAQAVIEGVTALTSITPSTTEGFEMGEPFVIYDVKAGDTLTLQHQASLVRSGEEYRVETTSDLLVKHPKALWIQVGEEWIQAEEVDGWQLIPLSNLIDGVGRISIR